MHRTLVIFATIVNSLLFAAEPPALRMSDGKLWTVSNLDVDTVPSFCYGDNSANCRQFGRLYPWDSARRACPALGPGWRLPTNEDWRTLVRQHGTLLEESPEKSRAAFLALTAKPFLIHLAGGRTPQGEYARRGAHGFYWTATESTPATAWFYNFGRGLGAVNRHSDGEKTRAFSVRCVRD